MQMQRAVLPLIELAGFLGNQLRGKKKKQYTQEKQDGMNSIIRGRVLDALPLFRRVTLGSKLLSILFKILKAYLINFEYLIFHIPIYYLDRLHLGHAEH
jgi:hypothetical protein